eukprot:1161628-Pelagomonas_calceolata.AAC.20
MLQGAGLEGKVGPGAGAHQQGNASSGALHLAHELQSRFEGNPWQTFSTCGEGPSTQQTHPQYPPLTTCMASTESVPIEWAQIRQRPCSLAMKCCGMNGAAELVSPN